MSIEWVMAARSKILPVIFNIRFLDDSHYTVDFVENLEYATQTTLTDPGRSETLADV
jgi:hypothetical protein